MATYYVDATGGADGNTGLSSGSAWQTLTKVNSITYSPGDSILFKKGEIWYGSIVVGASGNAINPITYSSYGTGAKPRIEGGILISAGSWTKTAGRTNVYEASIAGYNLDSVFAGLFGTVWYGADYRWMDLVASVALVDATARTCYYDTATDKIYVNTATSSNPASDGDTYYISGYDTGILVNGKSYITIDDISFRRMSAHYILPFDVTTTPWPVGTGIQMTDCEGYGVRHNGFSIGGDKMILTDCIVHYSGGQGGAFVIADLTNYPGVGQTRRTSGVVLTRCGVASDSVVWAPGVYDPKAILMEFDPMNLTINDFTLAGQQSYGFYDVDATYATENITINGFYITGTVTQSAVISYRTVGLSVSRLRMSNRSSVAVDIYNTVGFTLKQSRVLATNFGVRLDGTYSNVKTNYNIIDSQQYCYVINSGVGSENYNNVIYGAAVFGVAFVGTPGTHIFKNNIFESCVSAITLGALGSVLFDYNMGHNLTYWWLTNSLAVWQSASATQCDPHSSEADPKFISLLQKDFRILSNSPCISAGASVSLLNDFDGMGVKTSPDIGAYEYASRYLVPMPRLVATNRLIAGTRLTAGVRSVV